MRISASSVRRVLRGLARFGVDVPHRPRRRRRIGGDGEHRPVMEDHLQRTLGRRPEPPDRARIERHQRTQSVPTLWVQVVDDSSHLQHERAPDHDLGAAEPQSRLVIDPDERERGVVEHELPPTIGELSDPAAFDHVAMFARGPRRRTSTRRGRGLCPGSGSVALKPRSGPLRQGRRMDDATTDGRPPGPWAVVYRRSVR